MEAIKITKGEKLLVDVIAGARPNLMKVSPLITALNKEEWVKVRFINTGQHSSNLMFENVAKSLQLRQPDEEFENVHGSQLQQLTKIVSQYEDLLLREVSDACVVVGDVTSTMACAISAQKMHVKVAHVEAGIRSGDWTMPEEINRLVTDSITNYFFTTTEVANQTLRQSGVADDRIFWVGNTMIDTLLKHRSRFIQPGIWETAGLTAGKYIVMTLHRPANVDEESNLKYLIEEIIAHTHGLPLVFPVHPRTAKVLELLGINSPQLHLVEPMGYLEFNYLVERAKAVITDSGGITEETTVMGVPCMTLRNSTERPETVDMGTNELLGVDPKAIGPAMEKLFSGNWKKGSIPPLWDGGTSKRIVEVLLSVGS